MDTARLITFVMHILLLVAFIGLIDMTFNLHRFAFVGEFLILLLLLLIAVVSVMGINNNFRWAWILLTSFFAFVFINMLFIYAISSARPRLFLPLIIVPVIGFFMSLFSIGKPMVENIKEEIEKKFKPGKYVASKTGTKFHSPKCDWAKKIKEGNAVWLGSKEDARKAGYKDDECIK